MASLTPHIAKKIGTPFYLYEENTLTTNLTQWLEAFSSHSTILCFAVKANNNPVLLKKIFSMGFGADVVSQGELERALQSGAKADKIVFSGVGKTEEEILFAMSKNIRLLNVESIQELKLIAELSKKRKKPTPLGIRINPDIKTKTNSYLSTGHLASKFGISQSDLPECLALFKKSRGIRFQSIGCHLGSQITDLGSFSIAAKQILSLAKTCEKEGFPLAEIDLGGGLGIDYQKRENTPSIASYASTLLPSIKNTSYKLLLEPGRAVIASAGCLVVKILYKKSTSQKNFLVVDGGMNDFIRPALYGAYHLITPLIETETVDKTLYDVVGPVCESGDFLGKDRMLPSHLKEGDYLIIRDCGAYGYSMASQYNLRPLPAEVLLSKKTFKIIRKSGL